MSAVTVRRATQDDVPGIADVHVRSWQVAYRGLVSDDVLDGLSVTEREQSWRSLIDERERGAFVLVAELAGRVAGFCSVATPSRDADVDDRTAELTALYVDPECWREGVGAALLDAVLDELRERDWCDLALWVLPDNQRAASFYDRFGFEADDAVKREERSGQIVVRRRRALTG